MTKWPSKKELEEATKDMEGQIPTKPLSPNASPVDRTKHSICSKFIVYMRANNLSQQSLADLLGVDKALVSKVVHYHFDEFTIDRLIKYLTILDPTVTIEIKTKVA